MTSECEEPERIITIVLYFFSLLKCAGYCPLKTEALYHIKVLKTELLSRMYEINVLYLNL